MKFWSLLLAVFMALAGFNAEAQKRFGGGKSFGKQSNNVTQRQAPPPQQGATGAAAGATGAAAAATKRPWGAMLGGLAAGLGLAWLASSLGIGGAIGQILMFALLAMAVMAAVAWFIRSRKAKSQNAGHSPFAFQGASPGSTAQAPATYRPENVGNDASARPWERNTTSFETLKPAPDASGSMIGSGLSGLSGSQSWGIPAGFDTEGFLKSAKANFVSLQAAWDKSDINALRAMMTDAMLTEIQAQLAEREVNTTGGPINLTDVVMIEAHLLGIEDLGDDYMVSVEFSGMIREEPSSVPSPFREVWNMIKLKNGQTGWLVAGVQALQ